ncbi:hypothetical protein BDZ45DRAFT_722609 [Acephala macrosclerotiorum]|nr:hypothetical protein BDZ45DRAFT_722609 [Acephala macrosclerotiorum]
MLVDAIAFVDISVAPAGCGMAEVKETADAKTLVEFLQSDPTVAAGPVAKMTAAHCLCNTVWRLLHHLQHSIKTTQGAYPGTEGRQQSPRPARLMGGIKLTQALVSFTSAARYSKMTAVCTVNT